MSNDLWDIKKRILDEDRIEELLNLMECEHVKFRGNRYEAQLPDKFFSNSPRSVQCYLTESLQCRIRSRGISSGIDIFGLVSYIVFDIYNEADHISNLFKSKKWICETLGYQEFLNFRTIEVKKDNPLQWLKEVRKKRNNKSLREFSENHILPEDVLNQFVMYPYYAYFKEGLHYETQTNFQVGFDVHSERVIYPIHNQFGDIISVKGRTIIPDYKEKGIYKFIYLYNFNKMIEFYHWHEAIYYILEKKEVIIFEGEKSCWWASQYGYMNCIAISGDDISDHQVKMIKDLGIEIKIIIALDKDKTTDDFKKQGRKFGQSRQVYAMWDSHNLLSKETKDSPVDKGEDVFVKLYKDCFKHRIT
jgi:DNA primase